ncbi:MAG: nitrilase-related carbon-nitrogen hydrolase [Sulfuricurvum sp.]|jgi:predicted amidohydrolase
MKVALIQFSPQLNRSNLERVVASVESHPQADVILFPELALSGYLLKDKLFEDAWNREELSLLAQASLTCDIAVGAAMWDEGKVYNSALYFSQGALLHIHHKNHLPTYGMFEEGRYFAQGESIRAFETMHGSCVMVVCEDVWRAETFAHIALLEVDIIYVLAASPARDFRDEGLMITAQWDALLKSLALLTKAYVVFVNRVGFEDGLGFWGGSRVITPTGECEYELPLFEEASRVVELNHGLLKVERYIAKNS